MIEEPETALAVVERLGTLDDTVAVMQWPKGQALRVRPLESRAVRVEVASGVDWFALGGEVQVDEHRVLGLTELLALLRDGRSGRFVALGGGEYLALTEQLRRQLADLQAVGEVDAAGRRRRPRLRVPATAASWLVDALDGLDIQADPGWRERIARLDEAATLPVAVPAGLQAELRPYQHDGFVWMARLAHAGLGACLADDMGLGKTVQTLALLIHRAALGPALVVAPTSVCGNWAAEAARFAPGLSVQVYGEGDREAALNAPGTADLVIASYALVQRKAAAFAALSWATLVLDEAQALKNADTLRAKAVAALPAGFRLALSGTPVENRLGDLWSLLSLLNPGLLGSRPRFAERTRRVAAFQAGEGELFLISLKAGGFGLNLTAADYVIVTDPWWNPAAEDQALGRSHRMEQQRPVTVVYRLVTAGSIEERIVDLHGRKRQLADGILAGQDEATVLDGPALRALLADVGDAPMP